MPATAFFQYDDPSAPPRDEPFLAACTDEEWRSIAARCGRHRFRAGERIIAVGDIDGALLIILRGRGVHVDRLRPAQDDAVGVAGRLSRGRARASSTGCRARLTSRATTDGELLRLSRAGFDALAAAEPTLGRLILADLGRVVATRVRRLTERVAGE